MGRGASLPIDHCIPKSFLLLPLFGSTHAFTSLTWITFSIVKNVPSAISVNNIDRKNDLRNCLDCVNLINSNSGLLLVDDLPPLVWNDVMDDADVDVIGVITD